MEYRAMDRRTFLGVSTSCSAHLLAMAAGARPFAGRFFGPPTARQVVAQEPWGRLEQIGDGLWALISTPLEDRTTLSNGGIIAGSQGTLVVESFASARGAAWMAEQARLLTGRWPTHAVLTHFHGDHAGGIEGFGSEDGATRLLATGITRDLVLDGVEDGSPRASILAEVVLLDPDNPTRIDLGGRTARIVPRGGHTPSDVSVEIDDPGVVYCGDLVWNRMFPNYRDAIPSRLSTDVRALVRGPETKYVPGHGPMATPGDLAQFIAVIDHVESAARRAFDGGIPAAEAATSFGLPESLGEWFMFSPRYYEVALEAWERELGQ
ncbi:MAG: MBL fold metallo-hydrolase [Gemmatimonadetes bacterium]|nr:MBL fold metallo-hydrolase [Gemmatimonadota bacterium]